jgi:hypothetical protein
MEQAAGIVVGGLVLALLGKLAGLGALDSVGWPALLLIDSLVLVAGAIAVGGHRVGFRVPEAWWSPRAWKALEDETGERRRREASFQEFLKAGRRDRPPPAEGPGRAGR